MTRRGGPKYLLDPSENYSTKRADLSGDRLQNVIWAEEDIADDPNHNHWRRRTTRGTILDYFAADSGLLIEYKPPVGMTVTLLDLIDLIDPE